jgi:hypothetical protein
MIIEIDDDCLDGIIQGVIVENYVNLTNTLKKDKGIHPEDKEAYEQVVSALEVLGNWYFPYKEFDKAVKAARKKK